LDFVLDAGRVWLLHGRPLTPAPLAAARIAVALAAAQIVKPAVALLRVDPGALERHLHPRCVPGSATPLAAGMPASPGAAWGLPVFSAAEALERSRRDPVILIRTETDAADVAAMQHCAGILTTSGGMTSHAAVVARTLGLPCVVGAALHLHAAAGTIAIAGRSALGRRDWLTLDGTSGRVYVGRLPLEPPVLSPDLRTLLSWADGYRKLEVHANADTPADARAARARGAQGIGLCRTEHMFFDRARLPLVRQMMLAADAAERRRALAKLLPHQRGDFAAMFAAMPGLPVTIRLLDPPLHEFLPTSPSDQAELAQRLGLPAAEVAARVERLREANPMLGHRGCRLCITWPEILRMQVRAILEAACHCRRQGIEPRPRILVPLVMDAAELALIRRWTEETAAEVFAAAGDRVPWQFGSMIETPRAALLAGELARHVDFFSFGTNDLTQMALGISRDDAGSFLPTYVSRGILAADPFVSLDAPGVGQLLAHACAAARSVGRHIDLCLCGEHGGDAASIRLCHQLRMDAVSCSVPRLPLARLAAAQAALTNNRQP
jgi:pyruvate,orthophosphate dikinase